MNTDMRSGSNIVSRGFNWTSNMILCCAVYFIFIALVLDILEGVLAVVKLVL